MPNPPHASSGSGSTRNPAPVFEASLGRVARLACEVLGTPIAYLTLLQDGGLQLASVRGIPPLEPPDGFEDEESVAGALGVSTRATAPIRGRDDSWLGSLSVAHRGAHDWTPEEHALLEDLATAAGAELRLRAETDALDRSQRWAQSQKDILELLARDADTDEVLDRLARSVEDRLDDVVVSILLLNNDGTEVFHGAAPSLPRSFVDAVDGARPEEGAGSCGTAIARRSVIYTENIETDPLWNHWGPVALAHGLKACWSSPLLQPDGTCLGTFALYRASPGLPGDHEKEVIRQATSVAVLVVETHRGRRSLQLERERLALALEGSQAGVWDYDVASGEVKRSPLMAQALGYDTSELEGRITDWENRIHPDERDEVLACFQAHLRGDTPLFESEHRLRHRSGGWVWVLDRGRVVERDAEGRALRAVGTLVDISERKDREQQRIESEQEQLRLMRELEQQQARLTTLLQQLPVGVVLAEAPSGEVVLWNHEMEAMTQGSDLSAHTAADYGRWEAYWPDGSPLAAGDWPLSRALEGEIVRGEEFWSPDPLDPERQQWWRVNAAPIRDREGTIRSAVVTSEDITRHRTTEEALRQSQEQLRHAQKMEAVGRLAGGMAHDFNNLLTAILGYGEFLLEQMEPDSRSREDVTEIVDAAVRGRSLTHQLLAFSRKSSWRPEIVTVNEVVRASGRLLERVLGEGVVLDTSPDPDAGTVRVDRNQLEQVLVNTAVNARDAMPGRRHANPSIPATSPWTRIPSPGEGSRITTPGTAGHQVGLRVSDHRRRDAPRGHRAHAFRAVLHHQGPTAEGTGLGLATVYGILKQAKRLRHGVQSEPGRGSTFTVYLPVASQAAVVDDDPAPTRALPAGTSLVLLAEDQQQVRSLIARRLRSAAATTVVEARHGRRSARRRFERLDGEVDLVLTDVVMPEMDGRALAAELRARAPNLPVLYMSGYTGGDRDQDARSGSAIPEVDLLLKPFDAEELLARVAERLRRDAVQD